MAFPFVVAGPALGASVFVVNTANDVDDGACDTSHCSLREAINAANASAGTDTIHFAIVGTPSIAPSSSLPAITDPVVIDGTTQPGFAGSPIVEIDGTNALYDGLDILAGSSTVRGLVINRSPGYGILIKQNGGNVIEGNLIGTDVSGTVALGNGQGLELESGGNLVGGTAPSARNIISGNGQGMRVVGATATANVIQGNYIGTDISGSFALGGGWGVEIRGTGNTIGGSAPGAGNVISGNGTLDVGAGIIIDGASYALASDNVIQGNYIGTDQSGTFNLPNLGPGIFVGYAPRTIIGGASPGEGNVISGATNRRASLADGIQIYNDSNGTIVKGNLIGTNRAGTAALPNMTRGILVAGNPNVPVNIQIGGTEAGARNILSGNGYSGLEIGGVDGVTVQGNYIGTDITGMAAIPNGLAGIQIGYANNNTVGGSIAGSGNLISGNAQWGILLQGTASGNVIRGNLIGTDATGTAALGNGADGVIFYSGLSAPNTLGGTGVRDGNTIAFNGGAGVAGQDGIGQSFLGNSIHSNGGLGIDLGVDGVTPNDTLDADEGPNGLQNFPVLNTVVPDIGTTTTSVHGHLSSTPSHSYRIELFGSSECDPTGYGEGASYLGAVSVTTDLAGSAPFAATVSGLFDEVTSFITATATDQASGDTSEFSRCGLDGSVTPAAQTITFGPLADVTLGAPSFNLTATASSGLPVSYSASGPCSVSGSTLSVSAVGTCTVTASQSGNASWAPAADVSQAFTVQSPTTALTTNQQAMNGDQKVAQGSTLYAGFDFNMPGKHPSTDVGFHATTVTFPATCASGTPNSFTITVNIADQTYTDPANSTTWYPSGDQNAASTFQGSAVVPAGLCDPGALVRLQKGGTFVTNVSASPPGSKVSLRWHYRDGTGGGWSGTYSVTP